MEKARYPLIAAFGALVLYLLFVAVRLEVDFFDTFELLVNAKSLSRLSGEMYFPTRSIGSALLLVPFFWLERLFGVDRFAFVASHIGAVAAYTLFIWFTYRLLRLHLEEKVALFGALLLACNAIVLRVAPLAKEDIPGSLFALLAFYQYERKRFTTAGLAAFLAMGSRFQLIPMMCFIFGLNELVTRSWKEPGLFKKMTWLILVPVGLFFLLPAVVYPLMRFSSFWDGPALFVRQVLGFMKNNEQGESAIQNLVFLVRGATIPLFLLAILGMVTAWSRRAAGRQLHTIWFFSIAIVQSFFIGHKEARYLIAIFPPLYYFIAFALQELLSKLNNAKARAALLLAVFAWPTAQAIAECVRFRDPVYSTSFEREISKYANELAGGTGRIVWMGAFYTVNPRDYLFDPEDEYTSVYHFYAHVVSYYTGKRLVGMPPRVLAQDGGDPNVYIEPSLAAQIEDGDTFIINVEQSFDSRGIPDRRFPLVVERARVVEVPFTLSEHMSNLIIKSKHIKPGRYVVVLSNGGGQKNPIAFVDVKDGTLVLEVPRVRLPGVTTKGASLRLVSIEGARSFALPGHDVTLIR